MLGSDEGGPVPGEESIISRRDAALMRMAAGQTGGILIDGNNSDAAVLLTKYLRSQLAEFESTVNRTEKTARWFIFSILAIIAFGASKLCLLKIGIRK
jgi:hypothetical protein